MDILWANSDLTVEAQHLSGTGWKAAEQFEEAGTLLALPVRHLTQVQCNAWVTGCPKTHFPLASCKSKPVTAQGWRHAKRSYCSLDCHGADGITVLAAALFCTAKRAFRPYATGHR